MAIENARNEDSDQTARMRRAHMSDGTFSGVEANLFQKGGKYFTGQKKQKEKVVAQKSPQSLEPCLHYFIFYLRCSV